MRSGTKLFLKSPKIIFIKLQLIIFFCSEKSVFQNQDYVFIFEHWIFFYSEFNKRQILKRYCGRMQNLSESRGNGIFDIKRITHKKE